MTSVAANRQLAAARGRVIVPLGLLRFTIGYALSGSPERRRGRDRAGHRLRGADGVGACFGGDKLC
jgi:hypothetical protein